jgi:hypothetical protein
MRCRPVYNYATVDVLCHVLCAVSAMHVHQQLLCMRTGIAPSRPVRHLSSIRHQQGAVLCHPLAVLAESCTEARTNPVTCTAVGADQWAPFTPPTHSHTLLDPPGSQPTTPMRASANRPAVGGVHLRGVQHHRRALLRLQGQAQHGRCAAGLAGLLLLLCGVMQCCRCGDNQQSGVAVAHSAAQRAMQAGAWCGNMLR